MSEAARTRRRRRTTREPLVTTAWGERWLRAVEASVGVGRLGRGREYARSGRVDDLTIEPGHISAQVQGSRPTPYRVDIRLPALDAPGWTRAVGRLGGKASSAAALVSGVMPESVEAAFADAGVALYPGPDERLAAACTCPDWDRPCKHAAAVLYAVGARFDRDPFVLFALRGKGREALILDLRAARRAAAAHAGANVAGTPADGQKGMLEELAELTDRFWTLGSPGSVAEPGLEAVGDGAGLKRLGLPPRVLGGVELKMELALAYRVMADRARRLLEGD
jgi:uncharacterized Zn finger protein